ncbi:MAG: homocysteine S-methyltransferase [Rhodobacteraceae bacterium]|nr:homocysteine S-methyltransferase [Paracoccaceae bacterium]
MRTRGSSDLPQLADGALWLSWAGMETDLIFNQGVDLPGFASFPLLETDTGRAMLWDYYTRLLDLGEALGCGMFLDSVTWVANRDRAAELGYDAQQLVDVNLEAIRLMDAARKGRGAILSAQIGPRYDGYAPETAMSIQTAEAYHAEQVNTLAGSGADLLTASTLTSANEAAAIARAASHHELPVAISFTVETDGCLPDGMPLSQAILEVDAASNGEPAYYLVNCAHPEHLAPAFDNGAWMKRLRGVVANASRASHAELDNAEKLDDGNPAELGQEMAALRATYPQFTILGGCCGTDFRHLEAIGSACQL